MAEKQRIEFIDLAKGICILLVLAVHIVPEFGKRYDILTCLRMPLYFCLSGMFFKDYGGFKNLFFKKADKLLLPFFGWYLISYSFYYFRIFTLGEASEYFHILDFFTRPYFYNIPLWFLLSLFWVNFLYAFIVKISRNIYLQIPVIGFFTIIGWWFSFSDIPNWFFIGTAMTCLPFFFLGRCLIDTKLVKSKDLKIDGLVFTGCVALVLTVIAISKESVLMIYYNNTLESGRIEFFYFISAPLVVLIILACKYIGKIPYVSFLGRFSIIVLVTHELIRNVVNRSIRLFINPDWEDVYINLTVMVIVTAMMAIVIPLCRKYLPYITAQKEFISNRMLTKRKVIKENVSS